ncbi:MAG TPA: diapophytoene dehydrogenase [Saprospirales bacterium]|nr:diapophytoene dehydrogenase [Saprospirales bacterium]HAY70912.1 diapophytoene dehydrogenase [Saprospirales bacterium]HRQ29772.1 dihydrolipoamide acetyltransferase family protein [Saprospiraceae bacterium]
MGKVELIMPQMGEGVIEATILKWLKKPGDKVIYDETLVEIATDKVDSEIPCPADGTLVELFFNEQDVVAVGKVMAIIETDAAVSASSISTEIAIADSPTEIVGVNEPLPVHALIPDPETSPQDTLKMSQKGFRYYSPLVLSIARAEKISTSELEKIQGSGQNNRVTKIDLLQYLENRTTQSINPKSVETPVVTTSAPAVSLSGDVEIIEMDRMRKLIADYMVESKKTAPHVTSIVEVDVTNIVNWRKKNKDAFFAKYRQNLTFTPIFIQAIVQAIKDFPMINVSVEGSSILVKKQINIGMATALPSGNLIVPVIKNADFLSLAGLTTAVNDLAERARKNQLKPDEIKGGTYTLTNLGSFGNLIGTPIINQPEVAIMATGAIKKKPVVLETAQGDVIAIRQMMYLSHAYDHRVVDGYLGGSFVKRVGDYLENFDVNQQI